MKLFMKRLLWFLFLPIDLILAGIASSILFILWTFGVQSNELDFLLSLDSFPEADHSDDLLHYFERALSEDHWHSWRRPRRFDFVGTDLSSKSDVTAYSVIPRGQQTVNIAGLNIAVIVATASVGYRVHSVRQPYIVGQGISVTAAKYDFSQAYKSWAARRFAIDTNRS